MKRFDYHFLLMNIYRICDVVHNSERIKYVTNDKYRNVIFLCTKYKMCLKYCVEECRPESDGEIGN